MWSDFISPICYTLSNKNNQIIVFIRLLWPGMVWTKVITLSGRRLLFLNKTQSNINSPILIGKFLKLLILARMFCWELNTILHPLCDGQMQNFCSKSKFCFENIFYCLLKVFLFENMFYCLLNVFIVRKTQKKLLNRNWKASFNFFIRNSYTKSFLR